VLWQQVTFFFKFFTFNAVPALLLTEVNIALIPHALKKRFDDRSMAIARCTAKAIVLNIETLPKILKPCRNFITVSLWLPMELRRSPLDLLAMFIGSGNQQHIMTVQTLEPS
jgi:hypothetical protein